MEHMHSMIEAVVPGVVSRKEGKGQLQMSNGNGVCTWLKGCQLRVGDATRLAFPRDIGQRYVAMDGPSSPASSRSNSPLSPEPISRTRARQQQQQQQQQAAQEETSREAEAAAGEQQRETQQVSDSHFPAPPAHWRRFTTEREDDPEEGDFDRNPPDISWIESQGWYTAFEQQWPVRLAYSSPVLDQHR
jgi:hypothetical protein